MLQRLTVLVAQVGRSVAADFQRVLWWQARLSRGRAVAAADMQRASTDAAAARRHVNCVAYFLGSLH